MHICDEKAKLDPTSGPGLQAYRKNLSRGNVPTKSTEEELLGVLLAEQGATGPRVSALAAWRAFKDFAFRIQMEDGSGLLFQVGNYAFEGADQFCVDYVLQLESVGAGGEHEGFEQLHCQMTCLPTPEVRGIVADLWSFAYPTLDDYFAAVEALPEFATATRQAQYGLRVFREHV